MIQKAFILAAGLGTRLRPLTFVRPKPLIPVLGKPLIEHAIRHLKTIGIKNIIINTHHLPDWYQKIIGSGKRFGLQISYSHEPQLLDTGGGLKNAESQIGNETFIMYNSDIITDADLGEMIRFHEKNTPLATLLVSKRHKPLHVKIGKDYRIKAFGPQGKDPEEQYAFCGIHIIEPEIFRYIPSSKPVSIITIYQELIKRGLKIIGYPLMNAEWKEIGDIGAYKKISGCKVTIAEKKLASHGSTRLFSRIETAWGDSIVSMQYDPGKTENKYYPRILLFLKDLGINVPGLIYNDAEKNRLFMEDLGEKSLFSKWNIGLYKKAIDQIARLHLNGKKLYKKKPFPISKPFGYELYRWESGYFEKNCLINYFKQPVGAGLHKDFHFLAQKLSKERNCLIHRDFQSKNIMVKDGEVYLIDFQGMRFGLPHYDLASLLYDPYVNLPKDTREELCNYYRENFAAKQDNFMEVYRYTAIQRLMQALGAYGYLGLKLKKKGFLCYIPQAVKNLRLVLGEVDGLNALRQTVTRPKLYV